MPFDGLVIQTVRLVKRADVASLGIGRASGTTALSEQTLDQAIYQEGAADFYRAVPIRGRMLRARGMQMRRPLNSPGVRTSYGHGLRMTSRRS